MLEYETGLELLQVNLAFNVTYMYVFTLVDPRQMLRVWLTLNHRFNFAVYFRL